MAMASMRRSLDDFPREVRDRPPFLAFSTSLLTSSIHHSPLLLLTLRLRLRWWWLSTSQPTNSISLSLSLHPLHPLCALWEKNKTRRIIIIKEKWIKRLRCRCCRCCRCWWHVVCLLVLLLTWRDRLTSNYCLHCVVVVVVVQQSRQLWLIAATAADRLKSNLGIPHLVILPNKTRRDSPPPPPLINARAADSKSKEVKRKKEKTSQRRLEQSMRTDWLQSASSLH